MTDVPAPGPAPEPAPPPVAPPAPVPAPSPRLLLAALAALALLQAVTVARLAPLPAAPASAPADAFSAERAFATLGRLLGDQAPHPVGTPANAAVRERLLDELRGLGLAPQVQETWVWSPHGRGAVVRNVVARLEGSSPGQPILLLSHYDSVPAGPGASDDGMGVAAVLEVVRALKAGPPLARPVLVLVTDAEEVGLMGARAFVRDHPAARDVGVVVNLESRGTSGPSFMFETSRGNAWLVRLLADSVPRPLCSSLFPAVYEVLPNDTDLSVFLDWPDPPPSYNFGCIVDVDRYHTPLDDLAHLSRDTLQHHGDNALALTRALAAQPLEALRRADARLVYFDLFGLFVVRWPEPWSLALGGLSIALLVAAAVLLVRRRDLRVAAIGWGVLAWALALVGSVLLAVGVSRALSAVTGSPSPWAASLLAGHLGAWAVGWATAGAAAALLVPRAGAWGLWLGAWSGWALLGLLLAAVLPGACFIFIAPALVAGALGALAAAGPASPARSALAWLAPAAAAACLWLPLARGFDWALGLELKVPVVLAAAVVLSGLFPLLPASGRGRWALPAAAAAVGLLSLVVVLAAGPHSPERPQRVNVVYEEETTEPRTARFVVDTRFGRVPAAMVQAGGLAPIDGGARLAAPAAPHGHPPPELTVLAEERTKDGRRVRARVTSPRGAWAVRLTSHASAVSVDGQRFEPLRSKLGSTSIDLLGVGPQGVELVLDLPREPTGYVLSDGSFGLPPAGAALLAARPPWAVRSQQGDETRVTTRGRF